MIRIVSPFIALVLLLSCSADKNATIDKIIDSGSYTLEIDFTGDGGKGTEKLEIENSDAIYQATYTYLDYSKEDGPHEKQKQIAWGKEKDLKLKEFFITGVALKNTSFPCTITTTYRLKKFPRTMEFDDLSCVMTERFEALLK